MEIDKEEWDTMKAQMKSMYTVLTGRDPLNNHLPLLERLARLERILTIITGDDPLSNQLPLMERIEKLEKGQSVVRLIIIVFAIGFLVGGLVFGAIQLKEFMEYVKAIKP